jgi:glycosyltransferase involved in cell wall biosynthesis
MFRCARVPVREWPTVNAGYRVKILFVGGDFERKGGPLLLECMRAGLAETCDLHIVTQHEVPVTPGVTVHRGLGPNDPGLLALYASADIFALPTYADCLAVVLGEAMAAGLPIVTTTIGAQPEAVVDGRSGILIAPGDAESLGRALRRLSADPALRQRMGREGRAIAEARFDNQTNGKRLTDLILSAVDTPTKHRGYIQERSRQE